MLVTNTHVYNLKKKSVQRAIRISALRGCTQSLQKGNFEFVVHIRNEYDYRFICDVREELFQSLKACFFMVANDNLPIFALDEPLKKWETSKKEAKTGSFKIPPNNFRLWEEDVYEAS